MQTITRLLPERHCMLKQVVRDVQVAQRGVRLATQLDNSRILGARRGISVWRDREGYAVE